MLKIVLAVALTVLFGPGAGHLYVRQFKRGILLLLITIVAAVLMAVNATAGATQAQLASINPLTLYQNYITDHRSVAFCFDVFFAALWSFALVDVVIQAKAGLPPAATIDENTDHEDSDQQ